MTINPVTVLAYALFDSESTARLSEHPEAQGEYIRRAEALLYALDFRPISEICALGGFIQEIALKKAMHNAASMFSKERGP